MIYTSRWKQVLSSYNSVRARLLNSQALIEGTNLVLYHVNKATLVKWYKNAIWRDEMLMQGLSLPSPGTVSSSSLLSAVEKPSFSTSQRFVLSKKKFIVVFSKFGCSDVFCFYCKTLQLQLKIV